ncbi:MAG: hypothetical protein AAGC56_01955 [Pseudomonadota bacterium]
MQGSKRSAYCVGYRFTLKDDASEAHAEFIDVWTQMTHIFADQCGALGSRLHKGGKTAYFAYAQWPDKETYDREMSAAADELMRPLRARYAKVSEPADVVFAGMIEIDLLQPLPD